MVFIMKVFCVNFLLSFIFFNNGLYALTGEVFLTEGDYYLIDLGSSYTLLEKWKGQLNLGDKIAGELDSFGFKDIDNNSETSQVKVYIDQVGLNQTKGLEELLRKADGPCQGS